MTVKEKILSALENAEEKAVSGQTLARKLGVSRQAVWKGIKSLQEDGFLITASRNKGYILQKAGDFLSAERVREQLPAELKPLEIQVFDVLDSTNTYAKKLAADATEKDAVIMARRQTAGKGRRGHSFYSPDKSGLYMSLLLKPREDFVDISLYTVCAANAVCTAIETLCGKKPKIKWVNDIFLEQKKICGILTEATVNMEFGAIDSVIIGVGVNIATADFPDEIAQTAGSIGGGISRSRLAAAITEGLYKELSLPPREIILRYRQRSLVIGKEVSFVRNGESFTAVATGIADNGELEVRLQNGETLLLNSGEISVKLS